MIDESYNTDSLTNPYAVSVRERKRKEQLVEYLGEMLIPVTQGFEQINLDMTFTHFNQWELIKVGQLSMDINLAFIYKFQMYEYLVRGELATLENANKSKNGAGMGMFTTITTKSEQKYEDETQVKKGFSFFNFGKKPAQGGTAS